jgi:hypothetical protein
MEFCKRFRYGSRSVHSVHFASIQVYAEAGIEDGASPCAATSMKPVGFVLARSDDWASF